MNIAEAVESSLESLSSIRSGNTVRTYRNGLNHFLDYMREIRFDPYKVDAAELKATYFTGFVGWIGKHSTNRATAGIYVAGMKRFFRWLLANNVITPTPNEMAQYQDRIEEAQYRKGQKFTRTPEKGYAEALLSAVETINEPEPRKQRDIALIRFLYSTGLRNNEVRSLTVKDVDLNQRVAYVSNAKGDKQRKIYFNKSTAEAIRAYWDARGYAGKTDPLFCRHDKGAGKRRDAITTTTVRNVVDSIAKLAGIDPAHWSPHYFRHAFAIEALRKTGNLATVQDLLGHSSPHSTRIYAKIYDEDLEAAYRDVFDR